MINTSDIQNSRIFDFEIFSKEDNLISNCVGHNRKGLLVTVAGGEDPELKNFLEKILLAVNFSMDEDALTLWLTPPRPFCFTELARPAGIQRAIFFGIQPAQAGLNLNVRLYTPVTYGKNSFLFCDNLAQIHQNPALKRPLWEALKEMFREEG